MEWLGTLGIVLIACICVFTLLWAWTDAENRGENGCAVLALLVSFFLWPIGLLLWLIFRPKKQIY
jgi:hypothetical protein